MTPEAGATLHSTLQEGFGLFCCRKEKNNMATYGAKYLRFAKKKAAGVVGESFPTYEAPVDMGPLVSVTDAITYASAENFGDNERQEFVNEFVKIDVTAAMTEMPIETAAQVYGATLGPTGGIGYNKEDSAPDGCLCFYTSKQAKKNGVQTKFFQGVFYPNLKGSRQGTTYNTKGASITFANGQANFSGASEENGYFQVFSGNLATEAEAKAWCDKMLAGGAAAFAEAQTPAQ